MTARPADAAPPSTREPDREQLRTEARALARYLLRLDPAPALVERYADACAVLFPDPPTRADDALLRFAVRHPRLIAPLDAAAAIVLPGALLRRRILVMAAILETTPEHAERFLPRARSPLALFLILLRTALAGALHVAVGLPLLVWARRSAP